MRNTQKIRKLFPVLLAGLASAALITLFLPDTVVNREAREKALRVRCFENLKKLSAVCQAYADRSGGQFPEDILQEESVPERLHKQGFLPDPSITVCPSTHLHFPKHSCCFIPGVRKGMSPKMPCVIEKITNHDRMIGVIYVDGTCEQLTHQCQSYSELLDLFSGITSGEKEILRTHFSRLDIP